jgi:hypothetical protein
MIKLRKQFILFLFFHTFIWTINTLAQTSAEKSTSLKDGLDRSLKPEQKDEISALFENVVAVQRKAKIKKDSWLFNPYLSFDFSDSPSTMYGLNLNAGYAMSESWEVYLNYVPSYVTSERQIAKKVRDLGTLADGTKAEISYEKAKYSYGLEVNWLPAYGKDSWGPYQIIRSDTFLNLGVYQVKYETTTGMKYKFMVGKTFFISPLVNIRVQGGASYLETVSLAQKSSVMIGLLEAGLVFYF